MPTSKKTDDPQEEIVGWLSSNPSKRRGEIFFLIWSVIWIGIVAVIVAFQLFEEFDSTSYMIVGLLVGGPCFLLPVLFPGKDAAIPFFQRYTTKANIWIWIMSFIGNYFWTHYFYQVLGAKYTFTAWRLNDVPFCLFLMTQSYFATYHTFSTIVLRRMWALKSLSYATQWTLVAIVIFVFSCFVAFSETFTIQEFPYYELADRQAMYTIGTVFYALYFVVSFPMFYRLDEKPGENWSLSKTIFDSMACCMIVTCLLDAWRLGIGPIYDRSVLVDVAASAPPSFVY